MRGRKYKNPIHFGKRYGVSAWIPPDAQRQAAENRTEGLVGYFISNARSDWRQYMDDVSVLAQSCYLQGAADTAAVAAEMLKDIGDLR